MIRSIPSN